jgi:hypothetical protein
MENIVDIVEQEIVNKMNNRLQVTGFANTNIQVCELKWARINKGLIDADENPYIIESINEALDIITLTDDYLGGNDYVELEMPLYVHGTPKVTNVEWSLLSNNEDAKVPFIWLVEPVNERPFGSQSSIERESELRVFFCDNRDGVNWTNNDIHELRSKALYRMVDEFMKAIDKNPIFKPYTDYSLRNLTKLGTENAQGFEKNIIDSELTALELRLTLPIYKRSKNCIC